MLLYETELEPGMRFGSLRLLAPKDKLKVGRKWSVVCECSKEFEAESVLLIDRYITSCGCKKQEKRKHMLYAVSTESGFIKIGKSIDVISRIKELQIGNHENLTLLGISGLSEDDLEVHPVLVDHHKRGEWFYPSEEVRAFISLHFIPYSQFIPNLEYSKPIDYYCEVIWSQKKGWISNKVPVTDVVGQYLSIRRVTFSSFYTGLMALSSYTTGLRTKDPCFFDKVYALKYLYSHKITPNKTYPYGIPPIENYSLLDLIDLCIAYSEGTSAVNEGFYFKHSEIKNVQISPKALSTREQFKAYQKTLTSNKDKKQSL